jgi:hypothetical protein
VDYVYKKGSDKVSLDVYLEAVRKTEVYNANITHNLGKMAKEAGIYYYLWRPDEIEVTKAEQLIEPLKIGLLLMRKYPERFKEFDDAAGWGTYDQFVPWIEQYLKACKENPDAEISVSR